MLLMIESGTREGIETISHRHAKTNNEYMETEFDPAKESKCIWNLDANNLYTVGRCQNNFQSLELNGWLMIGI